MKLLVESYPAVAHVEMTLGLNDEKDTSIRHTTREVTDYLNELNKKCYGDQANPMTFKVFSGYAPYLRGDGVVVEGVVENVALLHLDFNVDDGASERFNTMLWYSHKLMEKFGQMSMYALLTDPTQRLMLRLVLQEEEDPTH